jgi:aminoglycoside 3-N-acetyltransferase
MVDVLASVWRCYSPTVRSFSVNEVVAQLRALGVEQDGVLLVHTSFKAVGPIEDGPQGLIRALREAVGDEGTLVMPTMTDGESVFDPKSTPTSGMGITAETFWRQPGVLRSTHPGGSFAAIGPLAQHICAPQPLSPPHGPDSPPGRVHDLGGQALLLGVGHSENTMLHVAEAIARVPYSVSHPAVIEVDGVARTVMIAETDHCCRRFEQMNEWLRQRGLQREGNVGNAVARLCFSRDLVSIAVEKLAIDPLLFLCPTDERCEECDLARESTVAHPSDT